MRWALNKVCLQGRHTPLKAWHDRALLGILSAAAAASLACAGPSQAAVQPFLSSTGRFPPAYLTALLECLPQAMSSSRGNYAAHSRHTMPAGAKGIIAEEEARLVRLRQEIEGEAREELQRARESLEAEGRNSASGKLCATPFGIDVVGISQASLRTRGEVERIDGP